MDLPLQFCIAFDIWMSNLGSSPTNTYINKMIVLQNNALRLIIFASDFRDHVTPLYIKLNLLKIKDLIILKNLLLIYDYFNNKHSRTITAVFRDKIDFSIVLRVDLGRCVHVPLDYI